MLALYDSAGVLLHLITEYDSLIAEPRFADHGEWRARLPLSAWSKVTDPDVYFARVGTDAEVYLLETPLLTREMKVEVSGRSASTLLELRTPTQTLDWSGQRAGQIMAALFTHLSSTSRSLLITMGTDATVGTITRKQVGWGDMSTILLDVCAATGAGFSTRFDSGGAVKLDMMMPADSGRFLGEKFNAESSSVRVLPGSKRGWFNYAYVLGEGEGSERVQVTVDQRAGAELRELYVDARDLQRDDLTLEQYQDVLRARGAEKLAEARRLDYVEADDMTEIAPAPATTVYAEGFAGVSGSIVDYDGWSAYSGATGVTDDTKGSRLVRATSTSTSGRLQRPVSFPLDGLEVSFSLAANSTAEQVRAQFNQTGGGIFARVRLYNTTLQYTTDGLTWTTLVSSLPVVGVHTFTIGFTAGSSSAVLTHNSTPYALPLSAAVAGSLVAIAFLPYDAGGVGFFGNISIVTPPTQGGSWKPGDVATYAGPHFSGSLMVTGVQEIHEAGKVTRRVSLGPPPPQTLAAVIKRQQL